MNTVRSPQGSPLICQAGGSPRGRQFAATWAKTVISPARTIAAMKEYRDDIRRRMAEAGRDPDSCKVLFLAAPILGETSGEAFARRDRMSSTTEYIEKSLLAISTVTECDFAELDLDAPVPDLYTNAEQGSLEAFRSKAAGRPLRDIAREIQRAEPDLMTGTPEEVAEAMEHIMAEVGGDGFLITTPDRKINRRYIIEVTEGLVPALQRRGLVRTEYEHARLRENLAAF